MVVYFWGYAIFQMRVQIYAAVLQHCMHGLPDAQHGGQRTHVEHADQKDGRSRVVSTIPIRACHRDVLKHGK